MIKKFQYFCASIFTRKTELILRKPPGENSNNVLTEMMNI